MPHLLIIDDELSTSWALAEGLTDDGYTIDTFRSAEAAWEWLRRGHSDLVITDLRLPGMSGLDLISAIKRDPALAQLPVIVHTGKDLAPEEEKTLEKLASAIVLKDARSPDRLIQEVSLFLHRSTSEMATSQRKAIETVTLNDPALAGKTVLIVDDDMRNIFAVSTILEEHDMLIASADNGRAAIRMLQEDPGVEIVLMDIMMPEMDGMETMREIRKIPHLKNLPIVAVTAKAMKGDREKCIEAGAWDYLSKPVDTEQLLAVLRAWLHR